MIQANQQDNQESRKSRTGITTRLLRWFLFLSLVPLLVFGLRAAQQSRQAMAAETQNMLLIRAHDIAVRVSALLNQCEYDLRVLAMLPRTAETYREFSATHRGLIWSRIGTNQDPIPVKYELPLYKEVNFFELDGRERIHIGVEDREPKILNDLRDFRNPAETTYRCEDFFPKVREMKNGEIYLTHLTGFHLSKEEQLAGVERVKDAVEGKSYDGVVRFIMPVAGPNGEREGYISIALDHRHLQEIIAHVDPLRSEPVLVTDYESGNYPYLVDDEGWFIAHPKQWDIRGVYADGTPVPAYIDGETPELEAAGRTPLNLGKMGWKDDAYPIILETLQQRKQATLELPSLGYDEVEPVMRFRAFSPILYDTPPYDRYGIFGGVVLGANSQSMELLNRRVARELWFVLGTVGLIVVLLAVFVSRDIARPLIQLAEAARDIGRGKFDRRLPVRGQDEVAEVTEAFNRMTEDIIESRERLRQAERFASIGEVVSGTAHAIKTELNLYGLINNIAVLERLMPDEDPRKKTVRTIRDGVEGLEHIVHELLDVGPEIEIVTISVQELLHETLEPIEESCQAQNIEVEKHISVEGLSIQADHDQIRHVMANVFSNALDAMPESGRLSVTAKREGSEVRMDIQDTGCGIPEELREKIFYPFFTTKKDKGGTGFGLYQSQRALARMQGRMLINSKAGEGTTVTVYLPEG